MLRRGLILLMVAAVILGAGSAAYAYSNVALNQPVTLNGAFGPPPPPVAAAGTVDDGIFLPENTDWQTGTVWWQNDLSPTVTITLDQAYYVNKFRLQADCNDNYDVRAYNGPTLVYTASFPTKGWPGMITRDDIVLGSFITIDRLVCQVTNGDNYYSVSEIQAFGDPVPVTASLVLLCSGLLGLGFWRRK